MSARVARFQTLVDSQPDNELFRFSLAQALIDDSREIEAVPHLEICVKKKADWMLPRILLGKTLLAQGQTAPARALLETALDLAITQDHEDPAEELRVLLASL